MPVHEVRYRAQEELPINQLSQLLAIPRFTLMSVFNKWLAVILFGIGIIQLLAYGGYLMLTNPLLQEQLKINLPSNLEIATAEIFRRFYLVQILICLALLVSAAPRMISSEIAHRALPLLYSRPIQRWQYVAGKFIALFILVSFLTWFQSIILFVLMLSSYPDNHAFHQNLFTTSVPLALKAVVIGILMSIALSLFGLACSAATRSTRYAMILIFTIVLGTSFFTRFVQEVISSSFPDFGLLDMFSTIGSKLLREGDQPGSLTVALVGVATWCVVSVLFMRWRLRAVEVYQE